MGLKNSGSGSGKLLRSGTAGKLANTCGSVDDCTFCTTTTEDRTMRVVISGLTDDLCTDCENLDGTHDLTYDGSCQWSKSLSDCSANLVMQMKLFAGSTVLEIRLEFSDDDIIWRKTYGAGTDPQDCSAFSSLSVPFVTNLTGQCDHDASAALVTAL